MKKDLQNAMTKNFKNMVGGTPAQEAPAQETANTTTPVIKKEAVSETPVINEPVVQPAPQQAPVQPEEPPVAATAVNQPVIPEPQPVAAQQILPVNTVSQPVINSQINEADNAETVAVEEPVSTKKSSKKAIPIMPDEKSGGVLHIRLGELRSYVDFMTQSGKISYQQYISNLIEQDYEKNKDLYLKYKSFMEQLNL